MIHIIRTHATPQQMSEMLEMLGTYVKLAVDIRPQQNNPALEILDPEIQQEVAHITRELLEGV